MFMLARFEPNCLAEPPREASLARDAIKVLEKKLVDGLARIDNELRDSQHAAAAVAAAANNTQVCSRRSSCVTRR